MRKVYLDKLPRWGKGEEYIDWRNSIGETVRFEYDDIVGFMKIIDYNKSNRLLKILYNGKEININKTHIKNAHLSFFLGKRTKANKVQIGEKFINNNRNIEIISDDSKENSKTKRYYKYKCNICGWDEGWIREDRLFNNISGCSCCSGHTVVEGINDIPTTAPWMVKYFQGGYDEAKLYTRGSTKKVYFKCPDCGQVRDKLIKIKNLYETKSVGCSCSDKFSFPNKLMYYILKQCNIVFEKEKRFDWCKFIINNKKRKGIYDFYFEINQGKYIVEMDGDFHYKNNTMSGQTKEESMFIDAEKDRLAKEHNIEVIRINCNKSDQNNIKNNIIQSILNDLLNLNKIDLEECITKSYSNLLKEICKYRNDNKNTSIKELSDIFKLHTSTIRKYLKIGNEFNWCQYIPNEKTTGIDS